MNFIRKIFVAFLFLMVFSAAGYFALQKSQVLEKEDPAAEREKVEISEPQIILENKAQERKTQENSEKKVSSKREVRMPFVVQAPFANWKDPVFQNACEEAAIIMAMGWINGVSEISPQEAEEQIEKLSVFEDEKFGYNTDTDIFDMQKIFADYYKYGNVRPQEDMDLQDIKNEIEKGNIVLVPTFGRALGNPNYTSPGPITHQLVVIGYDGAKKEFITNDSGTKRGKDYRYGEKILFDAIWSYPSGPVLPDPPSGKLKKAMLVVSR